MKQKYVSQIPKSLNILGVDGKLAGEFIIGEKVRLLNRNLEKSESKVVENFVQNMDMSVTVLFSDKTYKQFHGYITIVDGTWEMKEIAQSLPRTQLIR